MVTASEREIAFLSASELVDAYRRKTLSPVDVTKTALARLKCHPPPFRKKRGTLAGAGLTTLGESGLVRMSHQLVEH